MSPSVEHIFLAAFPFAFPTFWLFVCWLISRIGGWHALAREFSAPTRPAGVCYSWRSLHIAPLTSYSHCLNVTLSPAGIYLVPSLPFRFGSPPILIPWQYAGPLAERRFVFRWCELPIHAADRRLTLSLPCSAREWIEKNVGSVTAPRVS